jgi:hypothetical protein
MTKQTATTSLPQTNYTRLLSVYIFLDLILVVCFRQAIPRRDFAACRVGLFLVLFLTAFESDEPYKRPQSKRFRTIFTSLSTLEVLFTILVPWLSILEHLIHRTNVHGNLLASHLLIFQTQIALECIIILAGDKRKWIIFPFTILANLYRFVSILTWITRAWSETNLEFREVVLPAITLFLWIYSSFVFIPYEWYPLIKKTQPA